MQVKKAITQQFSDKASSSEENGAQDISVCFSQQFSDKANSSEEKGAQDISACIAECSGRQRVK